MKYVLLFSFALILSACDPGDVISIEVNPGPGIQDAVEGVQRGADQLNNSIQNFGEDGDERQNETNPESERDND